MNGALRIGSLDGEPSVTLAAGDLEATFLPGLGLLGTSLRHRGQELLALPGGVAGYRDRHVTGLPLLAPWANRLPEWRYRAAGPLPVPLWEDLQIPVDVAFFFANSRLGRVVGVYPSPAGATESELPLGSWDAIVAVEPVLGTLADDVEAALVRVRGTRIEAYLVPIDACYELVGQLRRLWRGFDGGREVRVALDEFFTRVAGRCR